VPIDLRGKVGFFFILNVDMVIRTLYNRTRRSEVPTQRIGTLSFGWNATTLTSPDAVSCVDRFASPRREIARVPEGRMMGP